MTYTVQYYCLLHTSMD